MAGTAVGGEYLDTVRITFSEPVSFSHADPLMFTDMAGAPALRAIAVGGNTMSAILPIDVALRDHAPSAGDSVWINTAGPRYVVDGRGVAQTSPGNRRAALRVVAPPDAFKMGAGPTLFNPTERPFVIRVRANERIGELAADAGGTATIYDGLGNIVLDERMELDGGELRLRWDGRNRSGSLVDQGTYLAIVKVTANDVTMQRRIKIGVDR
jgi:hypothetical protein